ncbi:hypothetical protein MTP99_002719 [Tenebrio molitor]|nr:hypothetical protein MTP99_002719 [Tenebrio molitor]CAH1378967.1 unnamed protein product [Tenebrio molitor]
MFMDDDEEKSFCYIEGTVIDKNAAQEISELHENVWFRMRPPKPSDSMYNPCVTARQIDLIRIILLGKTALKTYDFKPECLKDSSEPPPRRATSGPPSVRKRKSSVRFLNKSIYD